MKAIGSKYAGIADRQHLIAEAEKVQSSLYETERMLKCGQLRDGNPIDRETLMKQRDAFWADLDELRARIANAAYRYPNRGDEKTGYVDRQQLIAEARRISAVCCMTDRMLTRGQTRDGKTIDRAKLAKKRDEYLARLSELRAEIANASYRYPNGTRML